MTQPSLGTSPPATDPKDRTAQLVIPDATLAAWWDTQRAALAKRLDVLADVLSQATEDQRLNNPMHALWKKRWLLDARYRYVDEALRLLNERKHVLVCLSHGIDGVADDEWHAVGVPGWTLPECYEALSWRGLPDGKPIEWERKCEQCALHGPIEATAKVLHETHRRKPRNPLEERH